MQHPHHHFDRHDRVDSLIAHLAASFIQAEANTNPLITVTRVTTSQDYKKATVYITTLPEGPEHERNALIFLKRIGGDLRGFVKKKSNLKVIPHIDFALDVGERHRQHIEEIARGIDDGKEK